MLWFRRHYFYFQHHSESSSMPILWSTAGDFWLCFILRWKFN